MMKTLRYIITVIAAAIACATSAASSSVITRADEAYANDDFPLAARLYSQAIDSLGSSASLYYNLGNTWYRMGKPGNAILCYERALRLDPAMPEARANLQFVNSRLIDRPGERGTLFGNMLDRAALAIHSNAWAWVTFGTFLLVLLCAALYMFAPAIPLRKLGFFGGFAVLALGAVTGFLAARAAALASRTDVAVITAPSTILSTSPREPRNRAEEAMLLHEGTKLTILDSVSTTRDSVRHVWVDAMIDNEHRAWINRDDIEII